MHPGASFVDGGGVAEEKEDETRDAAHDQHHGEQHEEGSRFECDRGDGVEVGERTLAGELRVGVNVPHAVMEQAEVARLRRAHAVPDPIGLHEDYNVYHGETYGEYRPKHANGA